MDKTRISLATRKGAHLTFTMLLLNDLVSYFSNSSISSDRGKSQVATDQLP